MNKTKMQVNIAKKACAVFLSLCLICMCCVSFSAGQAQAATLDQKDQAISRLLSCFTQGDWGKDLDLEAWEASVAAYSMGSASSLNADALIANYASEASANALDAGRLGKYIIALTAARVDCTDVYVQGKHVNLIDALEKKISEDTYLSVYSAVVALPVFGACGYKTSESVIGKLISTTMSAQNSKGLFGMSGYEDVQTTSQAIMALIPYKDNMDVSASIDKAESAIMSMQDESGAFKYSNDYPTLEAPDTTAAAFVALLALGKTNADLATVNGATPLSFIMSIIDSDLKGFSGSWNNKMSSSVALLAFAADKLTAGSYIYKMYISNWDKLRRLQRGHTEIAGSGSTMAVYKITSASKLTAEYVKVTGSAKTAKTITVPSTIKLSSGKTYKVTAIAQKAAYKQTKATKIKIGNNVKIIGTKAFSKCSKVKTLYLGKSLKTIKAKAFSSTKKLKTVTVYSKKITKTSVKNLAKSSKIKTIKCKKDAKKMKKTYKKWVLKYKNKVKVK